MARRRMASPLALVLVVALAAGLVLFDRVPEASAQDCLEGRTFEVDVVNCNDVEFTDAFCFGATSMTVEGLDCKAGRAKITCERDGATFKATVKSGRTKVTFKGTVDGDVIEGTAKSGTCRSTYTGQEIRKCPCAATTDAEEEKTPYNP